MHEYVECYHFEYFIFILKSDLTFFQLLEIEFRSSDVKAISTLLVFSFFIVSCTVEKRLYNPGWNVQWRKRYKTGNEKSVVEKSTEVEFQKEEISLIEESRAINTSDNTQEKFNIDSAQDGTVEMQVPNSYDRATEDSARVTQITIGSESEVPTSTNERQNGSETRHRVGTILVILGIVLILGLFWIPFILLPMAVTFGDVAGTLVMIVLAMILGFKFLLIGISLRRKAKKMST